jgi:DNA polymerase I-like protein with 3'-5' exonuclease and polymerase domains
MADFVSHEPRVALGIKGDVAPDDIYEWFRSEHAPTCTRDQAKQAVIGTLYGMSASTLGEKTDTTLMQAKGLSEAVRVAFGLRDLETNLIREHRATGRVKSHFGREITPSSPAPGVLINSYIQSSAFDVAMAGFRHIVDLLAAQIVEVRVFFFIHDAMIFEVSERDEETVRSVLSREITIPGCPGVYKVKVKEVTE